MTDEKEDLMKRVVATVAAVLLAAPVAAAGYHHVEGALGDDVVISGCTVRFSGGQPWILANAGHRATGCESTFVGPDGFLWIDLGINDAEACPVMTTLTQSDETLTSRGIISGVRSGTHELKIQFTDVFNERPLDLRVKADYDRLGNLSSANVWAGAVHYRGGDCR